MRRNPDGEHEDKVGVLVTVAVMAGAMLLLLGYTGAISLPRLLQGLPLVSLQSPAPGQIPDDVPDVLREAKQLRLLADMSFAEAEDQMKQLARRQDAVGYLANVQLARRLPDSRPDDVEKHYRLALRLQWSSDVQWELAGFLHRQGHDQEAFDLYLGLPGEERVYAAVLQLDLPLEVKAEGLLGEELFEEAVELLEPVVTEEMEGRARGLYGQALAGLNQCDDAVPHLRACWQANPAAREVGWWYARCLEKTEDVQQALEVYRLLGRRGNYRRAVIAEQRGDLNTAAELYADSPEAAARWRGAQLLEMAGREGDALAVYSQLSKQPGALQEDAAFRAYLILRQRRDPAAAEAYAVIEDISVWMDRLGQQTEWPRIEDAGEIEKPAFFVRHLAYEEAGYEQLAELELEIGSQMSTARGHVFLGQWYLKQDDYPTAAGHGISALKDSSYREAYELAYPLAFREEVRQAAADFGLEPELLWAVMRQESFFCPDAVSRAGAIGLMQIMPATGAEIAANKGTEFRIQTLYDPQINIRFGAYYLRAMMDMFDKDIDRALAAYNAGPANARRWKNSPLGEREHGFVGAITFSETRRYVTAVRSSYLTYQWLDSMR